VDEIDVKEYDKVRKELLIIINIKEIEDSCSFLLKNAREILL
jgi:hypothetical protein